MFTKDFEIKLVYLDALVDLVNALRKEHVTITKFNTINNGLQLRFDGFDGDAVIHDFSYGHEYGMWETYGMPWDNDDVSVHEPEELAGLLGNLKRKKSGETENDAFLDAYNRLTAMLKAQAAIDIMRETANGMGGED